MLIWFLFVRPCGRLIGNLILLRHQNISRPMFEATTKVRPGFVTYPDKPLLPQLTIFQVKTPWVMIIWMHWKILQIRVWVTKKTQNNSVSIFIWKRLFYWLLSPWKINWLLFIDLMVPFLRNCYASCVWLHSKEIRLQALLTFPFSFICV